MKASFQPLVFRILVGPEQLPFYLVSRVDYSTGQEETQRVYGYLQTAGTILKSVGYAGQCF